MSNYFTRSITGSVKHTGIPLTCYSITQQRFYSDRKSVNHYDALGISSNASKQEIKAAFYNLSKKHHPDVNPHDEHAAQKFSTISNAYDILSDPVKRRDYDHELLSRPSSTSPSDPYVSYDRTSVYSQRARAHRPSSWKPPPTSGNSSGGFPGAENAFGSSQNSNYGTFDKQFYDSVFGRYRGPKPRGRSKIYDFDEFYRAHYADFTFWGSSRKEAQERMRREQQEAEKRRQEKANRSNLLKFSSLALWVSAGVFLIIVSSALHDMHFQQPVDEFRAKFYIIPKASKNKTFDESSSKS